MEKHGFVYVWMDRKHKRYYVGSHWGKEDDGYICSSTWMRNAYKRRPQDFKRRIIKTNIKEKKLLKEEEHRWLQMIPQQELGIWYYNLRKHVNGHWERTTPFKKTLSEICKEAFNKPEVCENRAIYVKNREFQIGEFMKINGHTHEAKEQIRQANIGRKKSKDIKEQISRKLTGRIISFEHSEKIRQAHLGKKQSEEHKQKIKEAMIIYANTPEGRDKRRQAALSRYKK